MPLYEPAGSSSGSPDKIIAQFKLNGRIITTTKVDGAFVAPFAGTITDVRMYRRTAGTSGSTTIDVNKNGTTIFTTQGNRPSVAFGAGADASATGTPDVTSVAQGDRFEVDVDVVEGGFPLDLSVQVTIQAS